MLDSGAVRDLHEEEIKTPPSSPELSAQQASAAKKAKSGEEN
jgi:hypothetical protein